MEVKYDAKKADPAQGNQEGIATLLVKCCCNWKIQ